MLAFPYYTKVFIPKKGIQTSEFNISSIQLVEIPIKGMTCNSCEQHVNHEIAKLSGVVRSEASFKHGNAIVEYDISKIEIEAIHNAINKAGYSVDEN